MNQIELSRQINKFKARRRKTRLATFCAVIATFLTLSSLGSGINQTSLITFLLLLPLPTYFALQSFHLYQKTHQQPLLRPLSIDHLPSNFSFLDFLTQPNFVFRFSLFLFVLVCLTTLARLRTPDPSLAIDLSTINH